MAKYAFVLITVMLFLSTTQASSHGSGSSFELVKDAKKIDVGYEPANLTALEPTRFDFQLLDDATDVAVPFSDVWVRFEQDKKTVFASGVHASTLGKTAMTFTFPESGEYTLSVRFQQQGETVADALFTYPVGKSALELAKEQQISQQRLLTRLGFGLAGALLIAFIFVFFRRKPV